LTGQTHFVPSLPAMAGELDKKDFNTIHPFTKAILENGRSLAGSPLLNAANNRQVHRVSA